MDYRINIKNVHAQIRERSNNASAALDITPVLNQEYRVTDYVKGWYYVEDFKGWVEVVNTILLRVVEPGDDDDPSSGTITPDPDEETIYDPEEVIKAFNKATNFADANRIYFLVDGKQVVLTTLLKSLDSSLVDIQTVVTKVQNMEAIPLLDNKVDGAVPVVVEDPDNLGKFIIKWTRLSYEQLDNLPTLNEIREW